LSFIIHVIGYARAPLQFVAWSGRSPDTTGHHLQKNRLLLLAGGAWAKGKMDLDTNNLIG